jgi:hypothetical protein
MVRCYMVRHIVSRADERGCSRNLPMETSPKHSIRIANVYPFCQINSMFFELLF